MLLLEVLTVGVGQKWKVLPIPWFDKLADVLAFVEEVGVWLEGLQDAGIAMIPEADGDATPLGQRFLCGTWRP